MPHFTFSPPSSRTAALIEAVMAKRRAQGLGVQCDRETPELTKEIGPFTAYFSTAAKRDRFIAKADAKGLNPQITEAQAA